MRMRKNGAKVNFRQSDTLLSVLLCAVCTNKNVEVKNMATKTINILGETQREQWHTVVNMLRNMGDCMTREGRSAICDELDRYIDFAEDVFDDIIKEQGEEE